MSEKQELPKYYDPAHFEPLWQKFWEEQQIFRFDAGRLKHPADLFSVDTPPPTVSGHLHIGHVYSYTQTEIMTRYQRMAGKVTYYPFGFDNNGLPTEILAEKDLQKKAIEFSREEFNRHCLEISGRYIQGFIELWKSLGFSCDWNECYSTISKESVEVSQRSFLDLFGKGHLAYRSEPTLWCTRCQTSFAQAEVNTVEIPGTFNFIYFKTPAGEPIPIATTRPELLASCVAVFIHPEHPRFQSLIGGRAVVPIYETVVPIIADTRADPDKGTGVVMCCTFGDATDIEWWREHSLPLKISIGPDGKLLPLAGPLEGLYVSQARKKIIELLKEQKILFKQEEIPAEQRPVNVHERCDTEVEFLPVRQWFIKILAEKEKILEKGRKVRWYPEHMFKRFEDWVNGLKWDWAISRQRYFGVPIPVWYCARCQAVKVASPDRLPVNPLTDQPGGECEQCGHEIFTGEKDVLDTWATSSVTPQIIQKWGTAGDRPYMRPCAMRPQAHDIIRTWAMYTIVKSHYHFDDIPWRDIVISGHVVRKAEASAAAGGKTRKTKISKSKDGNRFDPRALISENSADVIRLWTISSRLGTDTHLDLEELKEGNKLLTKLWNVAKFCGENLADFKPDARATVLTETDRWILAELATMERTYREQAEQYEMGLARLTLDRFFWHHFCDNYLEFTKFRMHGRYGQAKKEAAQATLFVLFYKILQYYSPIIPHLTETLYQHFLKSHFPHPSIHLSLFNERPLGLVFEGDPDLREKYARFGEELKSLVSAVRSFQTNQALPRTLAIDAVALRVEDGEVNRHLVDALVEALGAERRETSLAKAEAVFEIQVAELKASLAVGFNRDGLLRSQFLKAAKSSILERLKELGLKSGDSLPEEVTLLIRDSDLDLPALKEALEKLNLCKDLRVERLAEESRAEGAQRTAHNALLIFF